MASDRCTIANVKAIGRKGQLALESACVGVAGLGGVGGIAFELLVRAGVGRIRIADHGFFEESNANRQSLWSSDTDGMKKTAAALDFAGKVGMQCLVDQFGEICEANARKFASGCAAVIDATDSRPSRLAVWRGCRKSGAAYVFASAFGGRGMLTVFSGRDFEQEFAVKAGGRAYLSCDHALGPVANAIGCLAAQQAINIIIGKQPIVFPSVLSLDAFSDTQVRLHEF